MEKLILTCFLLVFGSLKGYSQAVSSVNQEKNLEMTMTFEKESGSLGYDVICLFLTNQSESKQQIIMPGDGSESAWREPHIYFTAEFENEQHEWIQLKKHTSLRCGLFDAEWQDDTTTIDPGQKVKIYEMAALNIIKQFNIPSKGTVRLRAHYDYKQGQHPTEHLEEIPEGYREILDQQAKVKSVYHIPAFELASDWVEIDTKTGKIIIRLYGIEGHPNQEHMEWFLNNYTEEFVWSGEDWKTLKHENLVQIGYNFRTKESNVAVTLIFCKNQQDALTIAKANFPVIDGMQIAGVNGGVLFVVQGEDQYKVNSVLGWFAGEE